MPLHIQKRNRMYRLVEPKGSLAMIRGQPADGGGHSTREKALRQLQAIEANRKPSITSVRG